MSTTDDLTETFAYLGRVFAELEATILSGWPYDDYPTDEEAGQIELAHHEMMLHDADLTDERAWYIAGHIVARFRRDLAQTSNAEDA